VGWLGTDGSFTAERADPEWVARTELVRVGKLIYERKCNAASDGNLSYWLSDDEILITPSGAHKGFLDAADLVVMDQEGRKVRGTGTPTSEYRVHARIYQLRRDIRCVIHVHAPCALAASLAGVDLHRTYATVPPVPTTDYAPPASPECPEVLEPYIRDYNGAILPRHGLVVWADSIWNAFVRVESIEHLAKAVLAAAATGLLTSMPPE
jgi:L-fuculose-phosphate aldolase